MQSKLHAIQFSCCLTTDLQWSRNPELTDFGNFAKLPKKTELPEKFEILDKTEFKMKEKRIKKKKKKEKDSCPPANPCS